MFSEKYIDKFLKRIVMVKLVTSQNESQAAGYLSGYFSAREENALVLRPWKDSEKLPEIIREKTVTNAVPVTTHILLEEVRYIGDLLDNGEIELDGY